MLVPPLTVSAYLTATTMERTNAISTLHCIALRSAASQVKRVKKSVMASLCIVIMAMPCLSNLHGMVRDGMGWDLMGFINYLGYGACHGSWSLMAMTSNPSPSLLDTVVSQLITIINQDRRNPSPSGTPETAETSDAGPKPPTATLSRVSLQHYCTLR